MKSPCPYMSVITLFLAMGCGQDLVEIPDTASPGSQCGSWYPPGRVSEADGGQFFAIREGETFPCLVFESARLAGSDTYINISEEYLQAKHGLKSTRAIVIIVGASNCPGCASLIGELAAMADELDAAGTLMIGAAWCDNMNINDCNFDLDHAALVLEDEGWPVERWLVTNDAEGHLKPTFSTIFPSVIVVGIQDMRVHNVTNIMSAGEILTLAQSL